MILTGIFYISFIILHLGVFGVVLFIFAIIIGILWIILPFAVFGVKDKLDTMIRYTERNQG